MKFDRVASSMIQATGENWQGPTGNFKGQLSGTTLSVALTVPVRPGQVLTRAIDDQQYLVLAVDRQTTHTGVAIVPVSYQVDVQRFGDTERDSFGRSRAPEAVTVLTGVACHQPAAFSVAVHQDPDRYDSRLAGVILLPDSHPIKEADTITTPSGPFIVRAVQRPTEGLQHVQVISAA